MQPVFRSFVIPTRFSLPRVRSVLSGAGYACGDAESSAWSVVFYDTQNGLVFRENLRLFRFGEEGPWFVTEGDRLFAPGGGQEAAPQKGDLPAEVDALVSGRKLIPQLELSVKQSSVVFDGASPGRILLQKWRYSGGYRSVTAPGPRVLCIAEQGDLDELERLAVVLREAAGSADEMNDPLEAGLKALELPLPGAPSPPELTLDSSDSVAEAALKILAQQEYRMRANTEGTIQDLDDEYLHDLRVAVRRARFAVRQFKSILPPEPQAELKEDLKWIGGLLGKVRDLDVFLDVLRGELEAIGADDVIRRQIFEHQESERRVPQLELKEALRSERYQRLTERLRAPSRNPADEGSRLEESSTVEDFGRRRIRKRAAKVLANTGREERFSEEELHQLRIELKGLRYTCEFYRELYPDRLRALIDALVGLQDSLGGHQDAVVAEARLQSLAETFRGADATCELGLVFGRLLERQSQKAVRHREEFFRLWGKASKRIKKFRRSL
jgi:CHAD domain-containing protein